MSRPDPCGAPAVAPLACIGLPLHIRQHHIPILAMLQGCRLPCRNRPFEFHPMPHGSAPWQALGNSQTARHEARGGVPGYGATVSKIKPDQASQQTVRGFAAADEGRQRRMGHRAALAAAAAAPIGQGPKHGPKLLPKTPAAPSGSAWLRRGPAIAALPFLFSRRKLRTVDGVVKSGAAGPQGRMDTTLPPVSSPHDQGFYL